MLNISLQFFAHKKGMGSTKNGRDSESKRLGPKVIRALSIKPVAMVSTSLYLKMYLLRHDNVILPEKRKKVNKKAPAIRRELLLCVYSAG